MEETQIQLADPLSNDCLNCGSPLGTNKECAHCMRARAEKAEKQLGAARSGTLWRIEYTPAAANEGYNYNLEQVQLTHRAYHNSYLSADDALRVAAEQGYLVLDSIL